MPALAARPAGNALARSGADAHVSESRACGRGASVLADSGARENAGEGSALPTQAAGVCRLNAASAEWARGERDRAAGMALTIQIVALQ